MQRLHPYILPSLTAATTDLIQLGVDGLIVAGIIPESSPNIAAYDGLHQLLEGEPRITSEYPGSVTEFFDFQEFYFGCLADTEEAVASLPISCTITVTGYRASNQVAQQSFKFKPGLFAVTAPMPNATLSKAFKGIDEVTFNTKYSIPDAGATLLESLSYVAYSQNNGDEWGDEWSR